MSSVMTADLSGMYWERLPGETPAFFATRCSEDPFQPRSASTREPA